MTIDPRVQGDAPAAAPYGDPSNIEKGHKIGLMAQKCLPLPTSLMTTLDLPAFRTYKIGAGVGASPPAYSLCTNR